MFCKPDELPKVDESLKNTSMIIQKLVMTNGHLPGINRKSAHAVAYAEMGNFYNGI